MSEVDAVKKIQACDFGVGQSLLGIAWLVSLATTAGVMALWTEGSSVQALFLLVGGIGLIVFLASWLRYRRQIQRACELCVPRLRTLGAVCQTICRSRSQVSAAACWVLCGGQTRCGF